MNKKRILLISANQYTVPYPVYPLGLSYISAYLQNKLPHYEIKIFDLVLQSIDDLLELLKTYNPEYTGVSLRNIDDVNIYSKEYFIKNYKGLIDKKN